jgi:hypothetical protein
VEAFLAQKYASTLFYTYFQVFRFLFLTARQQLALGKQSQHHQFSFILKYKRSIDIKVDRVEAFFQLYRN